MIFELHFPGPPLDKYVVNMVFYADSCPDTPIEKLLPDGSVFLLIDFEDKPKKCYRSDDFTIYQEYTRSYVSGQHREYIYIEATQHASMMVVQFKPGGAAPFLDCPLSELNGKVVHSEALFGNALNDLREALLQEPDIPKKFELMENFLLNRMKPVSNPALEQALQQLQENPFGFTTKAFAEKAGISQKHLIHLFDKYVGLTPKALSRVLRFQQVLQQIEKNSTIDWLQIVADCGYYDQSHFVKDFYAFSGINPGEYPDARGEYLNYLPIKPE